MEQRKWLHISFVVLGLLFVGFATWMTIGTYHPLPPGHPPVDGRGLFAPLIINPMAAIGGVLIAYGVKQRFRYVERRARHLLFVALVVVLSVNIPVLYMVYFTGPDIHSQWTGYVDWYLLGVITAFIVTGLGEGMNVLGKRAVKMRG